MTRNFLDAETSPYLRQHMDNPVHWRTWSEDTLRLAQSEGKPILLSIGYAACHWCHVMAHESFEDEATAAVMNELFVNVKVDREERPDIDSIYQSALALLGQQGGWPLTMFLTPKGDPFWGGTYFPPTTRWGRPGFKDVLRQVALVHAREPDRVRGNVDAIAEALRNLSSPSPGQPPDLTAIDDLARTSLQAVDPFWGGLSGAPKFPQPFYFRFLWRAWCRTRQRPFLDAVTRTLDQMSEGGIYDHLGGGFARYSTDEEWLVPHFEKMLYDNAQLIDLMREAWLGTQSERYRQRIEETVAWVSHEMIAEGGGFASTLDADSEGEEGKFYVWTEAEVDAALSSLTPEAVAEVKAVYEVSALGNWEGRVILNRRRRADTWDEDLEHRLDGPRRLLAEAREPRVRPAWDDKILADWNGMMIAALAEAAAAFERPAWRDMAERAFSFVVTRMTESGRLLHAHRHGESRHVATLEDYAQMARAALALLETTGQEHYLHHAESWVEILNQHYWDPDGEGYFLVADDAADVITRPKTSFDNAVPAGNGVMVEVLARLHLLTGKVAHGDRAEAIVRCFAGEVARSAIAFASLLNGWELMLDGRQIVIVGDPHDPRHEALVAAAHRAPVPPKVVQIIPDPTLLPANHPAHGKPAAEAPVAYVCRARVCSLPIDTPVALAQALGGASADKPRARKRRC